MFDDHPGRERLDDLDRELRRDREAAERRMIDMERRSRIGKIVTEQARAFRDHNPDWSPEQVAEAALADARALLAVIERLAPPAKMPETARMPETVGLPQ